MKKINKLNLIAVVIIFIISASIIFILAKTSTAKTKLTDRLNMNDLIMIGLAVLSWAFSLMDIYKLKMDKKKISNVEFNLPANINKTFIFSVVLLALVSICEIILFIINGKIINFVFAILLIPIFYTNWLHNKSNNFIGENGIYHWGLYHPWEKIKAFEIDENTLKIIVELKLFIKTTSEIKIILNINEKNNIFAFLNTKITY